METKIDVEGNGGGHSSSSALVLFSPLFLFRIHRDREDLFRKKKWREGDLRSGEKERVNES